MSSELELEVVFLPGVQDLPLPALLLLLFPLRAIVPLPLCRFRRHVSGKARHTSQASFVGLTFPFFEVVLSFTTGTSSPTISPPSSDPCVASLSLPSGDSAICLALPFFLLLTDTGGEGDLSSEEGSASCVVAALVLRAGVGDTVFSFFLLLLLLGDFTSGSGEVDSIVLSASSSSDTSLFAFVPPLPFDVGFFGDERGVVVVREVDATGADSIAEMGTAS